MRIDFGQMYSFSRHAIGTATSRPAKRLATTMSIYAKNDSSLQTIYLIRYIIVAQ